MSTDQTNERWDDLDFAPRKHFRSLLLPFIVLSAFVVFGAGDRFLAIDCLNN